jgi:hypothetical protein
MQTQAQELRHPDPEQAGGGWWLRRCQDRDGTARGRDQGAGCACGTREADQKEAPPTRRCRNRRRSTRDRSCSPP